MIESSVVCMSVVKLFQLYYIFENIFHLRNMLHCVFKNPQYLGMILWPFIKRKKIFLIICYAGEIIVGPNYLLLLPVKVLYFFAP